MKYKWKAPTKSPVPVEQIGSELERLIDENEGQLTPGEIVRSAKRKSSPIHNCFEWDDTQAARKFRETQARYLLRSVVVVYEDGDEEPIEVRLCVNIQTPEEKFYTTTIRAKEDPEMASYVEQQCLNELKAARRKYADLKAFFDVWELVDAL